MEQNRIILSARGLTKKYGETAVLSGIDLDIEENSFTVIMGPSGSGKSTLLYCLSGMDEVTEGTVRFRDKDITKLSESEMNTLRSSAFGFVFQSSGLIKNMTLRENILISGLLSKKGQDEKLEERVDTLIRETGLEGAASRFPASASGGEAQRAAVARAVIKRPQVLFADEPTGALNKANSIEVMRLLREENKKGRTVLLVTHDREAALYGSNILYLEDGRLGSSLKLPEYEGRDEKRERLFLEWLDQQRW